MIDSMRRRLGTLALLAAAVVLASACGPDFVRSGTERDPAERDEHEVGSAIDLDALTDDDAGDLDGSAGEGNRSSDAANGSSTSPAPGTTGGPAGPANVTVRLDERSGLQLTFIVADKLEFGRDEPIRFSLEVQNRSEVVRYVDSNQRIVFALFPEGSDDPAWHDHCGIGVSHETQDTGAQQLDPGATIRYTGQYPERDLGGGRDSNPDCRVPPAPYLALGVVDWCPDEAIEWIEYRDKRDPSCRPEGIVRVSADALRLTIHAA